MQSLPIESGPHYWRPTFDGPGVSQCAYCGLKVYDPSKFVVWNKPKINMRVQMMRTCPSYKAKELPEGTENE